MEKTDRNLSILRGIFLTSLITSNVLSSKIVYFWGLTVPAAVVAYPLTFLMTDVIGAHLSGMKAILVLPQAKKDLKHTLLLRNLEKVFLGDLKPTR